MTLKAKANFDVKNTLREINSNNVVAKLEGSDPALKNEYVVYSAHWDHLGRDPKLQGDQIFNGALDNASGTAALLEIAEAFTKLATPPKRSILFLAVTAEEKGLAGSEVLRHQSSLPAEQDARQHQHGWRQPMGPHERHHDGGRRQQHADRFAEGDCELLRDAASIRMPEPEKGFYYRSDHFEFAKQGVPALYTDAGQDYIGKDATYSKQKRDEYTNNDYHKVSDEIKPDWDLSGAIEDAQMLTWIGYQVAQADKLPEWKAGSEFKAKRDQSMRGAL